jgi:hypothetical protein
MRWPEATRLIDRIRRERPELTVDWLPSPGATDHWTLRVACILKAGRQVVPGSLDTFYGPDGWARYKEAHPEPWCRPEESYHTDALGREVDHRGQPVLAAPPSAEPIAAEAMLDRIVALGRSSPDWWKDPAKVAELAAAWGARTKPHGEMLDYEAEEVARIGGNVHASILIVRTGSGLFAIGIAARWGDGGTLHEPSVGSVPYDTEPEARKAAYRELIETLQARRGPAGRQQRTLLAEAVRQADRERGLFG